MYKMYKFYNIKHFRGDPRRRFPRLVRTDLLESQLHGALARAAGLPHRPSHLFVVRAPVQVDPAAVLQRRHRASRKPVRLQLARAPVRPVRLQYRLFISVATSRFAIADRRTCS